jgi:uncharacterized protein (DUF1330 family)
VYVIAEMSIHDRERYDRYAARFMDVLYGTGGRLLAADEKPLVVEGEWSGDKVVMIEFPDRESYERWATSDPYREIAVDRIAATSGHVLLVTGVPRASSVES